MCEPWRCYLGILGVAYRRRFGHDRAFVPGRLGPIRLEKKGKGVSETSQAGTAVATTTSIEEPMCPPSAWLGLVSNQSSRARHPERPCPRPLGEENTYLEKLVSGFHEQDSWRDGVMASWFLQRTSCQGRPPMQDDSLVAAYGGSRRGEGNMRQGK